MQLRPKSAINYRKLASGNLDIRNFREKVDRNRFYNVKTSDAFEINGEFFVRVHYIGFGKKHDEVRILNDIVNIRKGKIMQQYFFAFVCDLKKTFQLNDYL